MIKIRQAITQDAASITEFQVSMARETEDISLDRPTVDLGVQAIFDNPARGEYFVAEENEEVLGSLLITYEWSDWRNRQIWWIQSVYVRPESRGRGIFRSLYEHVRRICEQADGIAGLRLYVENNNTHAQEVYSRMGMNGDHYRVFEWMKEF